MDLQLRSATVADHPFLERLNREAYEELVMRQCGSWDDEFQRAGTSRDGRRGLGGHVLRPRIP